VPLNRNDGFRKGGPSVIPVARPSATGFWLVLQGSIGEPANRRRKTMTSPATKFRDGTLQVTVWRNTTTEGKTYYSVNPTRSYRQGDDEWRETDSLGQDDLLPMAELLKEAYAWIKHQKRADSKARKESQQAA
jgi:hypothetical protein